MRPRLFATAAALAALAITAPAQAATLDASAGSAFQIDFRINDGGPLPTEIIAGAQGPQSSVAVSSDLDAPGSTRHDYDTNVVAGTSAADPSHFGSYRSDSHGVGDIAVGRNDLYTYGVLAVSPEPPNDFVESQYRGHASTGVIVQSGTPMTGTGLVDAAHSRAVVFQNLTGQDYFFTLTGTISAWSRAEFNGASGFATAFTEVGLRFQSTQDLDITFAATSPFLPSSYTEGTTGSAAIDRVTNVSCTGLLGIAASARVQGLDPAGHELASASGGYDYLLGVTLKPGEVLTMTHFVTYRDETEGHFTVAPVPLPAGLTLLGAGLLCLGGLGARRRRRG